MMGVKADKFLHIIITDCEMQKDMKRLAGARSICLDAYGTGKSFEDGEHILYVNGEYRGDSAIGKLYEF